MLARELNQGKYLVLYILIFASTLIDNVYTNVLDKSHISGILIRPISDHQMYFCVMNENFRKPVTQSKHIEVEIFNEESISNFQNEIAKLEIHNELDKNPNKDPNYNYEILSTLLQNAKSKHIPKNEFQSSINADIFI